MIDISTEELLLIRDVPGFLPPRPNGKRVHVSAIYRWLAKGVRGMKLEAIKLGGSTYTSREALQRFAERQSRPAESTALEPACGLARQREIERAEREARRELGCADCEQG